MIAEKSFGRCLNALHGPFTLFVGVILGELARNAAEAPAVTEVSQTNELWKPRVFNQAADNKRRVGMGTGGGEGGV